MSIDISAFEKCRILVAGDLMIDAYLWGDVERISPEAPVQIVSVRREEFTLGGSGNVVNNLVALGASVSAIGVVGADDVGRLLKQKLAELNVDAQGVVVEPDRATTKKTRIIAAHQQVLRVDSETKRDISEQTCNALARAAEALIPVVDVVLISDYGKGLVTRPLVARLVEVAAKHAIPTIADPKGLDFTKYSGVKILTPNIKEAALAAGIEIRDDASLFEAGRRLLQTTGIEKLIITCGKDGMVFFEFDTKPQKIATRAREVFDVSGAGDTVLALLGLALASGFSFNEAMALANTAAGIVVGKVGTATVSKKELAEALALQADGTVPKQKNLAELAEIARDLRNKGKRIVLTNGCFDLLHVGHIKLLSASRQLGDVLMVAVDDDDSVKRLKGPGRPVITVAERVRIIAALDSVDHVTVFSTGQLDHIIETIQPQVLTKGSDHKTADVQGREIVERCGGRVQLIPITEPVSSTRIINNIRNK